MGQITTITVTKTAKRQYEDIRGRLNDHFKEKYNIDQAYSVQSLFPKIMLFMRENAETFIEDVVEPDLGIFREED